MQTLSQIKEVLATRGLAPKKSLGQNFLVDHNLLKRLVDSANVQAGDLVLEVGPGTGALTDCLLDADATVIACELDDGLADLLLERYADRAERFSLIRGDCLASKHQLSPALHKALDDRTFKLVANLPYGAASPLMVLLCAHERCLGQFVTIQREVAQRVMAKPNSRDYSELSVLVQAMCEVERIATLPPQCFWPQPKVTSEMISIVPRDRNLAEFAALESLCHALFTKRRKQLGAILGHDIVWPDGIAPTMRPEQLTVQQLTRLARTTTSSKLK
ncbi:MAG: ribosomal RNA small subunit methyltransferase A [Phycisphaerales bacterium]|nr:ribosomal RNA small subunit methyltransferase A [Phycisphaerales bacterium]